MVKRIPHSHTKLTYPKFDTKSLHSSQSHPSGSQFLILFLKSSRLFKFFISIGTICQTLEAKNRIEFRPHLLLFTEFLKKSDWVRKMYFINLGEKMLLIISFEKFYFILYSSIARLWVFLWWIVKEWSFWSNSWNELIRRRYRISKRLVKLTRFKHFPLQLSGHQDIPLLSFARVASSSLIRCGWVFISARSVENCISVERLNTLKWISQYI